MYRSLVIRCVALVMSMVWRRVGLGGVAGSTLSSSSTQPWSMDLQGTCTFVHSMYKSDSKLLSPIVMHQCQQSTSILFLFVCQLLSYCCVFFSYYVCSVSVWRSWTSLTLLMRSRLVCRTSWMGRSSTQCQVSKTNDAMIDSHIDHSLYYLPPVTCNLYNIIMSHADSARNNENLG